MTNSVLVTGASTGFGLEMSVYLAERGFQVYATMRDLTRRAKLEAEIAGRLSQKEQANIRILPLDVTDPAGISETVQTIVTETGGVYGLVNNAGQFIRGFFEDLSQAEIRQVIEVNVFGTMAVTRAVLPSMRNARRGRIVIISSVAGRIGSPSGSAYSASRFAQEGFAESLHQEVEPLGIYVSLVGSGIAKTESSTVARGTAARARDPNSPYYAWFRQTERLFDQLMQSSPITTQEVAETVHRALTVRQPRLRYMVGRRARLLIALRRYIPGDLFERIYFAQVIRQVTDTS